MSDFSKCSEQEAIFLASNVTSQSEKAANCLVRIQKRHDPQRYNECLRLAYKGKVEEIEKILNE